MTTIIDCLKAARLKLERAGVDTPRLDADLLLAHSLGWSRERLYLEPQRRLSDVEYARFEELLARRAGRSPLSHITGYREFWSLSFEVGPDVLDPRPDSETLVEAAISWLRASPAESPKVLDLGTGSGALLVSVLHECPKAWGWGLDLSPAALAIAQRNAQRLEVSGRTQWIEGPWAAAVDKGPFDLILSNPPYIPTAELGALAPEVRDHEPSLALDGGSSGLDAYRDICALLPCLVADGAAVFVEVGAGQAGDVADLLGIALCRRIERHRDLAGVERVVAAYPGGMI